MDVLLVLYALSFAILNGTSASIQKYGLGKVPLLTPSDFIKRPVWTVRQLISSKFWVVGTIAGFLSLLIQFLFIAYADLTLVAPLLNLNMLVVILIGVFILKEKITRLELIGVIFLLTGFFVMAVEQNIKTYNLDIMMLYLYVALASLLGIIFMAIPKRLSSSQKSYETMFATSAGILYGISSTYVNAIIVLGLLSFSLSGTAGIMLIANIHFWIFIILNQLAYIAYQSALSHGRSSIVYLAMNSTGLLVPVIAGILVFQEPFFVYPYYRLIGLILIVAGLISTSLERKNSYSR